MKYYEIIEKATGERIYLDETYFKPIWVVLKTDERYDYREISEKEYKFYLDRMAHPMVK